MAEKQTLNTSALLNWIKQYVSAVDIEKLLGQIHTREPKIINQKILFFFK